MHFSRHFQRETASGSTFESLNKQTGHLKNGKQAGKKKEKAASITSKPDCVE
jgi:hypothetical protein